MNKFTLYGSSLPGIPDVSSSGDNSLPLVMSNPDLASALVAFDKKWSSMSDSEKSQLALGTIAESDEFKIAKFNNAVAQEQAKIDREFQQSSARPAQH